MEEVMGTDIGIPGDPEEAFRGECEGGGIVKFVDDEMDDIVWWGTEEMGRYSHRRENIPHRRSMGVEQKGEKTRGWIGLMTGEKEDERGRECALCLRGWWSVSSRAGSQSYKHRTSNFESFAHISGGPRRLNASP
jgi:hypothetical protein